MKLNKKDIRKIKKLVGNEISTKVTPQMCEILQGMERFNLKMDVLYKDVPDKAYMTQLLDERSKGIVQNPENIPPTVAQVNQEEMDKKDLNLAIEEFHKNSNKKPNIFKRIMPGFRHFKRYHKTSWTILTALIILLLKQLHLPWISSLPFLDDLVMLVVEVLFG